MFTLYFFRQNHNFCSFPDLHDLISISGFQQYDLSSAITVLTHDFHVLLPEPDFTKCNMFLDQHLEHLCEDAVSGL